MSLIERLRSAGADGDAMYCWNLYTEAAVEIECLADRIGHLLRDKHELTTERDALATQVQCLRVAVESEDMRNEALAVQVVALNTELYRCRDLYLSECGIGLVDTRMLALDTSAAEAILRDTVHVTTSKQVAEFQHSDNVTPLYTRGDSK